MAQRPWSLVNTVKDILGDYAIVAPMELFMASKTDRHPTEIAKLRGARLVIAQETEKGRRWDVNKLKMLTSDYELTGRFMRQDFFDFKPTHKLIITGNNKPRLYGVDEAIRRRLLLVPFTVTIPEQQRDPDLANKLKPEWPAILRWMLDGCLQWQRNGLQIPDVVRSASDEYFAEEDVLGQWIDEKLDEQNDAFARTTELFASWKTFCERANHDAGTELDFGKDMVDRGYERDRRNFGRGFKDIKLSHDNG
jgi:putative DNA primase/helicase